jgi:hypothetical protein
MGMGMGMGMRMGMDMGMDAISTSHSQHNDTLPVDATRA